MLRKLFASRKHPYIPGINNPETIEFDLSGNKFSLALPPHQNYEGFQARPFNTKLNIYDSSTYQKDDPLGEFGPSGFSNTLLLIRRWELFGPIWRSQPIASIRFVAVVVNVSDLPEEMSCFNPNHFEQVLSRDTYFSCPAQPQFGEKITPLNWKALHENSALWLQYEEHQNLEKMYNPAPYTAAQYSSYVQTPLDDNYYLRLMFHNLGYAPVKYSIPHMNRVRDTVVKSVKLALGLTASQKLKKAQEKWPNAKASKTREPQQWVYPEWRHGNDQKDEPRIVLLTPGSPPPKYIP